MKKTTFRFMTIGGGGGMGSLALIKAGGEEVANVDWGDLQEAVFNKQPFFRDTLFIKMDIKLFTIEILNDYRATKGLEPIKPGDIDVILVSTSCTYISDLNFYATPFADSNLVLLETARLLDTFKSPLCIIENVEALHKRKKIEPLFNELKRSIHALKEYDFKYEILNCKDYDTPQSRDRFIGVCKLKSKAGEITFPSPTTKDYEALKLNRVIPTALGYCSNISRPKVRARLKKEVIGKRDVWCGSDSILRTITASGKEMILDAISGKRPFTVDELKKFFGIEEFNFDGFSDAQIHEVIGNGIAVPFLRCIAEHLVRTLLNK